MKAWKTVAIVFIFCCLGLIGGSWLAGCGDDDEESYCRKICEKLNDCGVPLDVSVDECTEECEGSPDDPCMACIEACDFDAACVPLLECVANCESECLE